MALVLPDDACALPIWLRPIHDQTVILVAEKSSTSPPLHGLLAPFRARIVPLLQGRILDVLLEEDDREVRSEMLADAFTPPEASSLLDDEVLLRAQHMA